MAKLSKKQVAYIKRNYDGSNLLEISKRLNIPLNEINQIVDRLKTSEKIIEKKYFPPKLEKIYTFTPTDYLIFIALFFAGLFTYVYTMTPGIAAGDCGELTCAVYFLGGAHSPGYPLYCVIGKLFMWLFYPIGRIVYRLTFLSAFGGAVTISASYLFFIKFLGRYHWENKTDNLFFAKIPAIAASLFFLFSTELWAQAVIAEVYTVNSLYLPIMFLIALVFEERVSKNSDLLNLSDTKKFIWNRNIKIFYLFCFLFGTAMGDHHIIAGYFIPFLIFFAYPYLKDKFFLRFAIGMSVIYKFLLIMMVYYKLTETANLFSIIIICDIGLYLLYKLYSMKYKLQTIIIIMVLYGIIGKFFLYEHVPYKFMAYSIIVIILIYIIYKLITEKLNFMVGLIIAVAFLVLGFAIYAYMPIRSLANAPLDWGDTEHFQNLINVIARKQYRGFAQNVRSLGVMLQQNFILLKWRLEQFTALPTSLSSLHEIFRLFKVIFILTLAFLGLFRLYKLNRKWFYFSLSFVLYYDVAFSQFNNFRFTPRDLFFAKVFFIPSYMFNLFWIVVGLEYTVKLFEKHVLKDSLAKRKQIGWILAIIILSISYLPFYENFNGNNVRHAWANDNYGRNLLKTIEYKSILFTEGGDNQVFSLLYHNYVEYLRPDVNDPNVELSDLDKRGIFDQKGNVFLLYGPMMRMTPQQLRESQVTSDYGRISTGRPIYYTWKDHRRQNEINRRYGENFQYRQMGILYRNCRKDKVFIPPIDYWLYYDFAWEEYPDEALYWDYLSREIIANYSFQRGDNYMRKVQDKYNQYLNYKRQGNKEKSKYYYSQYKKYDKLAYDRYRMSQKYGFDMTAIHFNLSLLLDQRIRFLQKENDIKGINNILDEIIINYNKAADIENKQGNAARAYLSAGAAYSKKALFNPEKEKEYMLKAKEMYEMVLTIKPVNKNILQNTKAGLQRANSIIKNPTKNVRQMEKNLQKNPRKEGLYLELLKIYNSRLEISKSIVLLEQGLRYLRNNKMMMKNLGNLYLHPQIRSYDKAVKLYMNFLQVDRQDPTNIFLLAESYSGLKKLEEAYKYYKLFLKIIRNFKNPNPQIQGMINKARAMVRKLAPQYE